ncbi:MAG: hypothetical protein IIZ45_04610 [Firmicutes bacterium]|nr:hypothetical protein [Bacillota bacterium]
MKNMYSLMLSEDVVRAIDRLAHEAGTNRSHMIDSILAEYISYRTPEQRIREMFDRMEAMLAPSSALQVMLRSSDSMLNLRSALAFKYNPSVRYTLELDRAMSRDVGRLKVSLRTQNQSLLLYLTQFYKLWGGLTSRTPGSGDWQAGDGRFVKLLRLTQENVTEDQISAGIVEYISAFDDGLKAFFYALDVPEQAIGRVQEIYDRYVESRPLIL